MKTLTWTMNRAVIGALLASTVLMAAPASAQSITGEMIIGGTNYFDPAEGFVPPGFGNGSSTTVPIGPGVEFGFDDTSNLITADFTNSTLFLTDVSSFGVTDITYRFTSDVAGFFDNATLGLNTLGSSYWVLGNTLTYEAPFRGASGVYSAAFTFAGVAASPNPPPGRC